MSGREEQEIERVLRESFDAPGGGADADSAGVRAAAIVRLLRSGAGEEEVVEHLSRFAAGEANPAAPGPADLVTAARALLKIGVRPRGTGWRRRRMGAGACTICKRAAPFCWSCTCGFRICQACLEENRWGMTCNNVTWECPECGGFRSF
ncbi:MAG: hypothetical protein HY812_16955 [Planctomycetes bacterium]|nr:hypothetical protein [Planctomycetota bacterium]